MQQLRERLTICRRDVNKLIETALEEGAPGDWQRIYEGFRTIVTSVPRAPTEGQVANVLEEMGANPEDQSQRQNEPLTPFPLGMVLKACADIGNYGPCGAISNWRDMMTAAVVVRSMVGVSPSAYQEACEVMGPENAATAIACILEGGWHINSGGWLTQRFDEKDAAGRVFARADVNGIC